jgi:hypothetical protein
MQHGLMFARIERLREEIELIQNQQSTFCADDLDAISIRLHVSTSPVSLVRQDQHWSIVTTTEPLFGARNSLGRRRGLQHKNDGSNRWRILALARAPSHWSTQVGEVCLAPALQGRVLPHRFIFFVGTVEHRTALLFLQILTWILSNRDSKSRGCCDRCYSEFA